MLSILKHSNVFYLFLNGTFMFVFFFSTVLRELPLGVVPQHADRLW